MLSPDSYLVLVFCGALLAGFLGGMGGRWLTLLKLRNELRAVLALVDPATTGKVLAHEEQLAGLSGRVDAAMVNINSVKGTLAQVTKREKLSPEDLTFLVAAVAQRLSLHQPMKAVP